MRYALLFLIPAVSRSEKTALSALSTLVSSSTVVENDVIATICDDLDDEQGLFLLQKRAASQTRKHAGRDLHKKNVSSAPLMNMTSVPLEAHLLATKASGAANKSESTLLMRKVLRYPDIQAPFCLFVCPIFILIASFAIDGKKDASAEPRPTESWTGYRAFVATWIFAEHVGIHHIAGSGAFFVLSGAVLSIEKTAESISSVWEYCDYEIKRLARILPAYWLVQAFNPPITTVWTYFHQLLTLPWSEPWQFVAMESWTTFHRHTWFVSTIIQAYLVYPFLCKIWNRIGTRKSFPICALVCCVAYGLQWVICLWLWLCPGTDFSNLYAEATFPRDLFGVKVLVYQTYIFRLPEFILGNMISHSLSSLKNSDQTRQNYVNQRCQRMLAWVTDAAWAALLCLAVASRLILPQSGIEFIAPDKLFYIAARMNLFSPVWCIWLFGMAYGSTSSWSRKVLSSKYALGIGQASYGVYLWSGYTVTQLAGCAEDAVGCPLPNAGIAYITTWCVAFLSYYLIEEPIRQFVKHMLPAHIKSTEEVSNVSGSTGCVVF